MSNTVNLEIKKNNTVDITIPLVESDGETPFDLTGYSVRSVVRGFYGGEVHLDLTASGSEMLTVVDPPTEGKLRLQIPADEDSLVFPSSGPGKIPSRSYVWDVKIEDGDGVEITIIEGVIKVLGRVTE